MELIERLLQELSLVKGEESYDPEFFKEHLAFRFRGNSLEGIRHPHIPNPDSLLNIDKQKEVLFKNTEQLVNGLPANDVLLWGSRGTGKSSLVKSTLSLFADKGLRIVQVYKYDIFNISKLYELLRSRELYFILFFDDLSFEPHDESFKVLKSLLEGDVEERPKNVLVYATSNRRNLMPNLEQEEKFPEESQQERVSLVERFGIRLGFFPFSKKDYLSIIKSLFGDEYGPEVEEEALRWATERGSFSGRVANQFYRDYVGRLGLRV